MKPWKPKGSVARQPPTAGVDRPLEGLATFLEADHAVLILDGSRGISAGRRANQYWRVQKVRQAWDDHWLGTNKQIAFHHSMGKATHGHLGAEGPEY